eukprot:SAG11_NODE_54_length_19571_cov_29.437786_17_plen_137_part_00
MDLSDELRFQSDETRQDIKDRVQYLSDLRNAVSISIEESRERMRKTAGKKRRTIDARLKVNSNAGCHLMALIWSSSIYDQHPSSTLYTMDHSRFWSVHQPTHLSYNCQTTAEYMMCSTPVVSELIQIQKWLGASLW